MLPLESISRGQHLLGIEVGRVVEIAAVVYLSTCLMTYSVQEVGA